MPNVFPLKGCFAQSSSSCNKMGKRLMNVSTIRSARPSIHNPCRVSKMQIWQNRIYPVVKPRPQRRMATVYAIGLYVEAAKAAKELKIRDRGDFFKDADSSTFCDAIIDGAFHKALQIVLVRNITSDQFLDAIEDAIGPRIRFIGANDVFEDFKTYIKEQDLEKGKTVMVFWDVGGFLDVGVAPESVTDFSKPIEGLRRFENVGFCRSLFELYMGSEAIIPEAKEAWATGAKLLLESTKI